jgi:hypothetical protein
MTSGLDLDRSARASPRAPVVARESSRRCLQCDAPIELDAPHWLVNSRPWCAPCKKREFDSGITGLIRNMPLPLAVVVGMFRFTLELVSVSVAAVLATFLLGGLGSGLTVLVLGFAWIFMRSMTTKVDPVDLKLVRGSR